MSSSSGVPLMFSSRLVVRLALFHGHLSVTAGATPPPGVPPSSGPLPPERRSAFIPIPRDFLHRFAKNATNRSSKPGRVQSLGVVVWAVTGGGCGRNERVDVGPVTGFVLRGGVREGIQLVEKFFREGAQRG